MKVIIAAGGTAGHINPALAIAQVIKKNEPESDILFIGREDGMEKRLVDNAGFPFYHMEIHGLERGFRPKDIAFNAMAVRCMLRSTADAGRLFRSFKPDVVIGCGGYVSGPVVRKAAIMGYKTAILEQNAFPGITTKLLARRADLIMVASEDVIDRIGFRSKTILTGNPIREEFFGANREQARKALGIGERTCVVSFGGSLGARKLNEVALEFIKLHAATNKVYHIHATGQYAEESFPQQLAQAGIDIKSPSLDIRRYIDDMPECFCAADLIISRSGAITISELSAAGRASVLIPSPNVTENHQYYNAMSLANVGAAIVREEDELDAKALAQEIFELCLDKARLKEMGVNARSVSVKDSAGKIYSAVRALVK